MIALALCVMVSYASAAWWDDVGNWVSQAAEDAGSWVSQAAEDAGDWVSQAAEDTGNWVSQAVEDTGNWIGQAATDAWDWTTTAFNDASVWAAGAWGSVTDFFNPPSTEGLPTITREPELPEGIQKMYLGYPAVKTGLDNGYNNELEIGKDDPHFGIAIGKFYVSGFTGVTTQDGEHFIFLKTLGDEVKLHFQLAQDIDMIKGDTFITINQDTNGYDKQFGIPPTDFGRGTLIVRFTDYQNHTGTPQIYTDYLAAKASGSADTVISLNEEGDYEVALDYEIKKNIHTLGTGLITSSFTNYRIHFKFSVRNGNCMVFPFDLESGEELKNTAVTPHGFRLDLAKSRYLDINVKRSVLTEGVSGIVEDIRFNRPARDGDKYDQDGIYTITVRNEYTGQETIKTLYVGNDQKLIDYVTQGYTLEQIIKALSD